jgi:hypothetical protein
MREELIKLLDRYYSGETTVEEEAHLKAELLASGEPFPEKDIFSYYSSGTAFPQMTEESLFSRIEEKPAGRRFRLKIFSLSAAAGLLLLVSLFTGYLREQKTEQNIKTMEQALSLVSGSLQSEEEPDMLVLWIDNNVEVIIN